MQKIEAVIFDFWGVVGNKLHWVFDDIIAELGLDATAHTYFVELLMQMEAGAISEADFWVAFKRKFGIDAAKQVSPWLKHYEGLTAIDDEVMSIISALKKSGIKVGLLSNADVAAALHVHNIGVAAEFDEVVFSAHVGLLKPDAKIYHTILRRLGVSPDASLFIDDRQQNIDGAQKIGMHAILFEGAQKLRQDLARYSLTVH